MYEHTSGVCISAAGLVEAVYMYSLGRSTAIFYIVWPCMHDCDRSIYDDFQYEFLYGNDLSIYMIWFNVYRAFTINMV